MDAPRPSPIRSILGRVARNRGDLARSAVLILCIGAASSAAPAVRGASAATGAETPSAGTPGAPQPLFVPDTMGRDASQFRAVAMFVEMANGPTAVPTSTPVPSPTPAPTSTSTPLLAPTSVPQPVEAPPAPAGAPILPPPPTEQPPPPPPPAASAAPSGLDTAPMDAPSRQLFDDTNARRASAGLPALRVNGYLIGIARIRSRDMADHNYFAHVSPVTGDDAFLLMDRHGVPYGWAGENLAKNNYPDDQAVSVADVALWNSPPHRENILNPNYTDLGIALVIDATGMKYFTIIFTGPP